MRAPSARIGNEMKKHWKEAASPGLRRDIEALLAQPYVMTDGRLSTAQADMQVMELVFSHGLDCDPPRTCARDKIAELKAAGTIDSLDELNRLYRQESINLEADAEQRNLVRYRAMERWRREPSREVMQQQQAAAAAHAAAVEARALAIVAEENAAALERARQRARIELEAK